MPKTTIRCTDCYSEFTEEELKDVTACPKCGTSSVPCSMSDDVTININWHELRILGIWASNWSDREDIGDGSRRTLDSILTRLERQHPNKTPLSLRREVQQLQDEFPSAELIVNGKVSVPKKTIN